MKEKTEAGVRALAEKAATAERSDDAMKYAQAALNLAHVLATLDNLNS